MEAVGVGTAAWRAVKVVAVGGGGTTLTARREPHTGGAVTLASKSTSFLHWLSAMSSEVGECRDLRVGPGERLLLRGKLGSLRNPRRHDDPHAPPEPAVMRFGDTEIVVLGVGLRNLACMISANTLEEIRRLPEQYRHAKNLRMVITSITVRRANPQ